MIADKIYGFLFTDLNIQPYRALCAYVFITENYFFTVRLLVRIVGKESVETVHLFVLEVLVNPEANK